MSPAKTQPVWPGRAKQLRSQKQMVPPSVECGAWWFVEGSVTPASRAAGRNETTAAEIDTDMEATAAAPPPQPESPAAPQVSAAESAKRATTLVTFLDHYRRDADKCQVCVSTRTRTAQSQKSKNSQLPQKQKGSQAQHGFRMCRESVKRNTVCQLSYILFAVVSLDIAHQ